MRLIILSLSVLFIIARKILKDIFKDDDRKKAVKAADIVVSMLPARFHIKVAEDCISFSKHLVTASYVSEEIKKLDEVLIKNLGNSAFNFLANAISLGLGSVPAYIYTY